MASVEEGVSVISVGRTTPVPAGQNTAANSLPVVVASDQTPVPILDNLSAPSQVRDDLLGIPRVQTPLAIFDDTNLLDIDQNIWATNEQTTSGVKVTQVNHLIDQSAAEIRQGRSSQRQRRQPDHQTGFPLPDRSHHQCIFWCCTVYGYSATLEFGMFDASDGYFLRVVGTSLFYVRRTSSGERPSDHLDGYTAQGTDPTTFTVDTAVMTAQPNRTDEGTIYKLISTSPNVMEEIVPRKYWNGDTMVGEDGASLIGAADTGSGHKLSLTNLCMVRIEYGWYGGTGSRLLFYVPKTPTSRPAPRLRRHVDHRSQPQLL